MSEIFLTIAVLFGQTGAFISLLNRKLVNTKHSWFRAMAMTLAVAFLIGLPLAALFLLHRRGILSDLAHFRCPRAGVWLLAAYLAALLAAAARFLWVSLVTLPRRKRPPIVVAEKQSLHLYQPEDDQKAKGIWAWRVPNLFSRLNCRFDLEVNEFVLMPPDLPQAFDGFSIVHLSDIHAMRTRPEGWYDFVATAVEQLEPDLIAITGDFLVDGDDFVRIERVLPRLRAPRGVWAILGNHDLWEAPDKLRDLLARRGIGLLTNRRTEIGFNGATLDLVGVESPWNRPTVAWRELFDMSSRRTTIVLSHTPDNAPTLARMGVTLMLAGHTHGGQIRLPWIGSLIVPSRYGKRYDQGWFTIGSLPVYVNRGIGAYSPDMRLACRPEITRFVLRASGPKT